MLAVAVAGLPVDVAGRPIFLAVHAAPVSFQPLIAFVVPLAPNNFADKNARDRRHGFRVVPEGLIEIGDGVVAKPFCWKPVLQDVLGVFAVSYVGVLADVPNLLHVPRILPVREPTRILLILNLFVSHEEGTARVVWVAVAVTVGEIPLVGDPIVFAPTILRQLP